MAGIYIHIPFCRKACHYCDFHFSTSLKTKDSVLEAISKELSVRSSELSKPVETIYFGGGTPSLLSADEMSTLLRSIHSNYAVLPDAEITLEANPEDISVDSLEAWNASGINRLSIGIQSFDDDILEWMNRNHSSAEAVSSVKLAQEAGIKNISIDLIYGIPHRSIEDWKKEIQLAIGLDTPHISAYCLTIEPQTVFGSRAKKGALLTHTDEHSAQEFKLLRHQLSENGIELYEISNFSTVGFDSQHNSNYWKGKPYVGVGPGAHSFTNGKRSWNISNNSIYAKGIMSGELVSETEELSMVDRYNEYIMTHLRMKTGIALDHVNSTFDMDFKSVFSNEIARFTEQKLLNCSENVISLTTDGFLMADKMASELFQTND